MTISLTGTAESLPPDHWGPAPDQVRVELTSSRESYEEALRNLRAQLPDGSRLLLIRTTEPEAPSP